MIVNKTQLSKIFGVSQKLISDWHAIPNFPVVSTGGVGRGKGNQYETKAVLEWYVNREMNKKLGGNQAAGDGLSGEAQQKAYDLNVERARLAAAQADSAEIKRDLDAKAVLPADEVLGAWAKAYSTLRGKLRAIGVRVAKQTQAMNDPKQIQLITNRMIDEVLADLASYDGGTQLEDADDELV